jgi:hypothetical protein
LFIGLDPVEGLEVDWQARRRAQERRIIPPSARRSVPICDDDHLAMQKNTVILSAAKDLAIVTGSFAALRMTAHK